VTRHAGPPDPGSQGTGRHFPTVTAGSLSAEAICWLFAPSAAARIMRLRRANDCGVEAEGVTICRVSAAARRKVAAAQRARWAKVRAAKK
jgi:hypothetical protein